MPDLVIVNIRVQKEGKMLEADVQLKEAKEEWGLVAEEVSQDCTLRMCAECRPDLSRARNEYQGALSISC